MTIEEIKAMLENDGFEIVETQTFESEEEMNEFNALMTGDKESLESMGYIIVETEEN